MNPSGEMGKQHEILLARGTGYRILSVKQKQGIWEVEAEVVQ